MKQHLAVAIEQRPVKRQMHHDSLLCQVFWMACSGSPTADASLGPIYVCCVSPPLLHVFHDRRPIEPIVICTPWMIRGILVKTCSDRFALCSSERFDFQSQRLHQQALCCGYIYIYRYMYYIEYIFYIF